MEILFLYLKDHGPFLDQELNFTSNHKFKYDRQDHTLLYQPLSTLPAKFFSQEQEHSGNMQISAIVGNNGSGKTTIAQAIANILLKDTNQFEHILILKMGNAFYMSCLLLPNVDDALLEEISLSDKEINKYDLEEEKRKLNSHRYGAQCVGRGSQYRDVRYDWERIQGLSGSKYKQEYKRFVCKYSQAIEKISFQKLKTISFFDGDILTYDTKIQDAATIIYHSNFYNTTDNWWHTKQWMCKCDSAEFFNISTTSNLHNSVEIYINPTTGQAISGRYSQTEMYRKYELLQQARFLAKEKTFCKKFSLPMGVRIEANSSDWNRWVSDYTEGKTVLSKNSIDEFLKKISEFKGDILFTALNFWKEFFVSIFGNWAYYHTRDQNVKFQWQHPDRIKTFFEKLLNCIGNYFNYNCNPDPDREPRGMVSFVNEVFQEYIKEESLLDAKSNDGVKFANLTPSLNDIYQLIIILDKYSVERQAPYIELRDETLEDFEKIWRMHDRIATITSFLSAEYTPSPSSGEISYLSIYARLYNVLSAISNKKILVFFDETEITMHPELQRTIVCNLIEFFATFASDYDINMFFLTHSPILLSDIPIGNVCFLRKKEKQSKVIERHGLNNTFGCNIFELFKDSFFLDKGTIGEFSRWKINSILKKIGDNHPENISNADLQAISQIGDDIIRRYIENYLASKCRDTRIIKQLVAMYKARTAELEKKLGACDDKD